MTYAEHKEAVRQKAIDMQQRFDKESHSFEELLELKNYFYKLGKRYGLVKEFIENGLL